MRVGGCFEGRRRWSGLVRVHVVPLLEDEEHSVDVSTRIYLAITSQEFPAVRVDVFVELVENVNQSLKSKGSSDYVMQFWRFPQPAPSGHVKNKVINSRLIC